MQDKLESLKSILQTVVSEIPTSKENDLLDKASKMTAAMMQTLSKKVKRKGEFNNHPGRPYSQAMREFSLSLHNISPAAYEYVRESLDWALPDTRTLIRWMGKIDCSPGLHEQGGAFIYLCILLFRSWHINTIWM